MAAALSIPSRSPRHAVPGRDLVIFLAATTIVLTLVINGLTLPLLIRALGAARRRPRRARAARRGDRDRAGRRARARARDGEARAPRRDLEARELARRVPRARLRATRRTPSVATELDRAAGGASGGCCCSALEAERRELYALRDAGTINDETLREIEARIDHAELRRRVGAARARTDDASHAALALLRRHVRSGPLRPPARRRRRAASARRSPKCGWCPPRIRRIARRRARPPQHRLAMLRLALDGSRGLSLDDARDRGGAERVTRSITLARAARRSAGRARWSSSSAPTRSRACRLAPLARAPRSRAHRRRRAARAIRFETALPGRARAAVARAPHVDGPRLLELDAPPAASSRLPIVAARHLGHGDPRGACARGGGDRSRCAVCCPPPFWTYIDPHRLYRHPTGCALTSCRKPPSPPSRTSRRTTSVLDVRKLTSLFDTLDHRQRRFHPPGQGARQPRARQAEGSRRHDPRRRRRGVAANGCSSTAGDIVVHVMQPAVRAYYNLEELWAPPRARRRATAATAALSRDRARRRMKLRSSRSATGCRRGSTPASTNTRGALPREMRARAGRAQAGAARPPAAPSQQILAAKRERIDAACAGATIVALDERGAAWTTARARRPPRRLAQRRPRRRVRHRQRRRARRGLKQKAAALLALSAMTLPHGLVRVLLAEQLYRAASLDRRAIRTIANERAIGTAQ